MIDDPASGRVASRRSETIAFVRAHPDTTSGEVRRALGRSAAASLATIAAMKKGLTRKRNADGHWIYRAITKGMGLFTTFEKDEIVPEAQWTRIKGTTHGGWSMLIANAGGDGAVLFAAGRGVDNWFDGSGSRALNDNGLDDAPEGLSIWEGCPVGADDDVDLSGGFRPLTDEEWKSLQTTGQPWETEELPWNVKPKDPAPLVPPTPPDEQDLAALPGFDLVVNGPRKEIDRLLTILGDLPTWSESSDRSDEQSR